LKHEISFKISSGAHFLARTGLPAFKERLPVKIWHAIDLLCVTITWKTMKTNPQTSQAQQKSAIQNQTKATKRPENKDDLDSRSGEEQHKKGDDVTHNKKEKRNEPKKGK
jgi:hypothetical protein